MPIYLFILLSLISSPSEKAFCSCSPLTAISLEELEDYHTILTGKVLKIDTLNSQRRISIKVKTTYKGTTEEDQIEILTPKDLSMCGLNIGEGREWLFYTYENDGDLYTNSCTRSGDIHSYLEWVRKRVKKDIVFLENLKN